MSEPTLRVIDNNERRFLFVGHNPKFEVTNSGLVISQDYEVEITEEAIADLAPIQRVAYRDRIGQTETTSAVVALFAPGSWCRVEIDRGQA